MQNLKIYILIEGKQEELRIDGNLDTLRGILAYVFEKQITPCDEKLVNTETIHTSLNENLNTPSNLNAKTILKSDRK